MRSEFVVRKFNGRGKNSERGNGWKCWMSPSLIVWAAISVVQVDPTFAAVERWSRDKSGVHFVDDAWEHTTGAVPNPASCQEAGKKFPSQGSPRAVEVAWDWGGHESFILYPPREVNLSLMPSKIAEPRCALFAEFKSKLSKNSLDSIGVTMDYEPKGTRDDSPLVGLPPIQKRLAILSEARRVVLDEIERALALRPVYSLQGHSVQAWDDHIEKHRGSCSTVPCLGVFDLSLWNASTYERLHSGLSDWEATHARLSMDVGDESGKPHLNRPRFRAEVQISRSLVCAQKYRNDQGIREGDASAWDTKFDYSFFEAPKDGPIVATYLQGELQARAVAEFFAEPERASAFFDMAAWPVAYRTLVRQSLLPHRTRSPHTPNSRIEGDLLLDEQFAYSDQLLLQTAMYRGLGEAAANSLKNYSFTQRFESSGPSQHRRECVFLQRYYLAYKNPLCEGGNEGMMAWVAQVAGANFKPVRVGVGVNRTAVLRTRQIRVVLEPNLSDVFKESKL